MTVQDPPPISPCSRRLRRWVMVVLGALAAAILLAQFVMFPWIVKKAVNQALDQAGVRDVRFKVSRATAWGSELSDVSIGDGSIGRIDRIKLDYSAGDLWNGKLHAIRIAGADITLNVRDGKIDFGPIESMVTTRPAGTTKPARSGPTTLPVGRIELSDSKVTFITPKQSVEVPLAGSVVQQSDGHLSLSAQVGQEHAMTVGAEWRDGKLTFAGAADPGRTLVIVRHIWPDADVSVDGRLKLTGQADKSSGSARLEIDSSFVTALRPANLHLSRGVFKVDANFTDKENPVRIEIENAAIALADEGFSAEGLNGELALRGFDPLATAPNQKLVAESMRIGDMELTDGTFEFQMLDRDKIHVNHTAWNWLGGKVWVDNFTFTAGAPIEVTLNAEDVELKDLLTNFAKDKATGEGKVSGQVPVIIHDSHVHFGNGKIAAIKGGDVQITDMAAIAPTAEAAAALAGAIDPSASAQIKQNVIEALANFQYDTLSAELVNEGDGLVGKVRMRGKGRTGAKQPLNYELNVHGIDKGLRAYLRIREVLNTPRTPTTGKAENQ